MITSDQLAQATGCMPARARVWCSHISAAMDAFDINTPARQAAFLAQIAHETGHLVYLTELWGPTPAQSRYEGRADLGNTQQGDGFVFRGRGLIQTTGRANYAAVRDGLRRLLAMEVPDFVAAPELLATPYWASMSAGWYWQQHGCNDLADADAFERITRKINGGLNGQADRVSLWADAKAALTVEA